MTSTGGSPEVLPASAGMILVGFSCFFSSDGAPRIRGDDPKNYQREMADIACSPHPRG